MNIPDKPIPVHGWVPRATWVVGLSLALLVGLAAACDSTLERVPDDVPLREIIEIDRHGGDTELSANDTDFIFAKISDEASLRKITFTTTHGSFIGPPETTKVVHAARHNSDRLRDCPESVRDPSPKDDRLVACVVLRADSSGGEAMVTAAAGAANEFEDRLFIQFKAPHRQDSTRQTDLQHPTN